MLKTVYGKIKYEIGILLFLLLQFFAFLPTRENMPIWPFLTYLGDYSKGFMPRALIGEIISWFTPFYTQKMFYFLSIGICILTCVFISLLSGFVIKNTQNKTAATAIVAIMISSPIFMPLFSSWLGITDIYLIFLTLLAFTFNENKILRCLVPIIMLICTAIHHAYLFLYMVPVAIALLYDFFKNKKYIRDGLLCAFSYISLIFFGLFCVNKRDNNGFASLDEMIDFMVSKTDMNINKNWLMQVVPNEYLSDTEYLFDKIGATISLSNLLGIVLIFSPLLVLFAFGWFKAIKESADKSEKFIFFLCLIQPISTIPAYIFALNWNRWTSSIVTAQCMLYLFMLYRKNKAVIAVTNKLTEFFKKHFSIVILYLIYFASFAKLLGS